MKHNPQDGFIALQEMLHAFADTFGHYPPASKLTEFLERLNKTGWMLIPIDDYMKLKHLEHSFGIHKPGIIIPENITALLDKSETPPDND